MKIETLKSSKDFKRLKNGKFHRSQSFLLQAMENVDSKIVRVGYTVTKQNGNAVIRNRIKRRLRSVAQEVFNNVKNIKIIKDARGWEKPSDHVPVVIEIDLED